MRIALLGNFDQSWTDLLMDGAHAIDSVWMTPSPQVPANMLNLLTAKSAPLNFTRITENDIDAMMSREVDLLVSMGYPFLIPGTDKIRGINVHPTLLPDGRGPAPMSKTLLEHPESFGVTIHKMAASFDSGDILLQEQLPTTEFDTCDTLLFRMYRRSAVMAKVLFENIDHFWENAKAQPERAHWVSGQDAGFIDPQGTVKSNMLLMRAFGASGLFYHDENAFHHISSVSGWVEAHGLDCGTIVFKDRLRMIIAVADGYLLVGYSAPPKQN